MDATVKKSLGANQEPALCAFSRAESSRDDAQLWNSTERDMGEVDASVTFGECLRVIRHRLSYKQSVLAEMIGCTESALSFWETGARSPSPKNMMRLLGALVACRVSTPDLLMLRGAWRLDVASRPRALRASMPTDPLKRLWPK